MYLEGKSLEIMALQLTQLVFGENRSVKPPTLRPADVECIHEARDILVRNLENPPSLLGLARQVGLNDTKLKRGFRQVFGATVFGYLQSKRMERGRQLLAEGKINVTEVAYEVGYSSRAHFSRAFTKQFGLNPIVYLRGNCNDVSLA
jgi:AraC-like DNA-binding protein